MSLPDAAVVVSLPCPRCGDRLEPDDDCPTCAGEGIVLRRVPPREAGRPTQQLRELGEPWPPATDAEDQAEDDSA